MREKRREKAGDWKEGGEMEVEKGREVWSGWGVKELWRGVMGGEEGGVGGDRGAGSRGCSDWGGGLGETGKNLRVNEKRVCVEGGGGQEEKNRRERAEGGDRRLGETKIVG